MIPIVTTLGVDLASRSSAYTVVSNGQVHAQGDSFGKSEGDFVAEVIQTAADYSVQAIAIEDLPHRIPYRIVVKEVCRLQGRLTHEAKRNYLWDQIFFIQPALWQQSYEGVWRGGEKGARAAAEELGYFPPDLISDPRFELEGMKGKERTKRRNLAKKLMTDYTDSFLISHYMNSLDLTDLPERIQQYHAEG